MNKKILIIAVLALLGAGGAYKTVLAKPKKAEPKPKVHGEVYVLPKEFLVNLADGRYAKLSVALVVEPAAGGGGHGGGRSEEHTSELQSRQYPGCRLLLL